MSINSRWRAVERRSCRLLSAILACAVFFGGCASYTEKPISHGELVRALADLSPASKEVRAGAPSSYSPDDGLTLQEAEVVALFYNPSLRSVRLAARIPVLSAEEAGLWDDPELGADFSRVRHPEPLQVPWAMGASLSFTIPISGRLAVEKSKATAEGRAALSEVYVLEQQVLADLRDAWIEWASTVRAEEKSREQLGRLDSVVEFIDRREEAGEMAPTEAGVFRLARARLRVDTVALDGAAGAARLRVLRTLGFLPTAPLELVPDYQLPASAESHGSDATASHPKVLQRISEYEVAEESLRLEVRKQYPDLQLGGTYAREDGQEHYGFGFSIPLPILNANKRGIVEASAAREAARAAWEEAVQDAIADLEIAKARLEVASKRRTAVVREVVPLAEKQMADARRLAELGEIDALLLLESLETHREAAIDLIDAEAEVARAHAAILAVIPTPDTRPAKEAVR